MKTVCPQDKLPFARATVAVAVCLMLTVPTARAVIAADVRKVTLIMREFKFEPATIQLQVGEEVELTIQNPGKSTHEWLVGSGLVKEPDGKGFQKDLFTLDKFEATGRRYALKRAGLTSPADPIPRISSGVRVEPGGEVTLRFIVPASARGVWQMACLLSGHYETGMKGTLLIE